MTDFTARAREIVYAWLLERPSHDIDLLVSAIAAALQAAHDEAIEEAANMMAKTWAHGGDLSDAGKRLRKMKHADRRGEGGGA